MKLNNLSDLDDELFNEIAQSFDTPNLIELLGMAKNCIVEVLDSGSSRRRSSSCAAQGP